MNLELGRGRCSQAAAGVGSSRQGGDRGAEVRAVADDEDGPCRGQGEATESHRYPGAQLVPVLSTWESPVEVAAVPVRENSVVHRPGAGVAAAVQFTDVDFPQLVDDSSQAQVELVPDDLGG